MYSGKLVFAQLTDFLPRHELRRCVDRYQGNLYVKTFTCWDQYLSMSFAQLTFRESLRDIEACLRVLGPKLYHMGIHGRVSRNTLANANSRRDWRIWADFAQARIAIARPLYVEDSFGIELDQAAYALDATTIDPCLSLFPWASFRRRKGGIKVHTLLDLRGNIPVFVRITPAQLHEVNLMQQLCTEPGASTRNRSTTPRGLSAIRSSNGWSRNRARTIPTACAESSMSIPKPPVDTSF